MYKNEYQYKVIIKGSYGESNFGDDTLMLVLFYFLNQKISSSQIAFICKNTKYLLKLIPDANILTKRQQKKATAELFLYGGGTQFFSFSKNKTIFRQSMSILKFFFKTFFHKKKYKYTAAIGIGLGPFYDKGTELIVKNIFKNMSYVAVRDSISYSYMKKWKITKAKQFTDMCYLVEQNKNKNKNKKAIGIIVRDWKHTKNGAAYYHSIFKLFEELKIQGYFPTLIIFAKNSDKYWMNRINSFRSLLIWEPEKRNMHEFIKELDFFDILITSRFHGAVFSALLTKPFISINVEKKLEIIADEYSDFSKKWSYPFDVNECIDYILNLENSNNNLINNFQYETLQHVGIANSMMKDFLEFLNKVLK